MNNIKIKFAMFLLAVLSLKNVAIACDFPAFIETGNRSYVNGDIISRNGVDYKVIVAAWANSSASDYYFAPGTGTAWTQAWSLENDPCQNSGSDNGESGSGNGSGDVTTGCNYPIYIEGANRNYNQNDIITRDGENYRVIVATWANSYASDFHYAPGTGRAWTLAWSLEVPCETVDTDNGDSDSNGNDGSKDETTGCNYPVYIEGANRNYSPDDIVTRNGENYKVIVAPWANSYASDFHYAPGTGTAWTQAWTLETPCETVDTDKGGSDSGDNNSGGTNINANCNLSSITSVVSGSCLNSPTGRIVIKGLGGILSESGEVFDCEDGELISAGTSNFTVNSGELKRLESGHYVNAVIDGGTLIICGTVTFQNVELINGGAIINMEGSVVFNGPLTIAEICRVSNNRGSMVFNQSLFVNGLFMNYEGDVDVYSNYEDNGAVINNSTMTIHSTNTSLETNLDDSEEDFECQVYWPELEIFGSELKKIPAGDYLVEIRCGQCAEQRTITVPVEQTFEPIVSIQHLNQEDCAGILTLNSDIQSGKIYPEHKWMINNKKISTKKSIPILCDQVYSLEVLQINGCVNSYEYEITSDEESDNDNSDEIVIDEAHVDIEKEPHPFTESGSGIVWDASEIPYFSNTIIKKDNFTSSRINPIGLSNSLAFGETKSGVYPDENIGGMSTRFESISNYEITFDAEGTLNLQGTEFNNCKRVKVTEIHDLNCVEGCFESPYGSSVANHLSNIYIKLTSYHWYAEDGNLIFTYSEIEKTHNPGNNFFFSQETSVNTSYNNINYNALRESLNIVCQPNPATSHSTLSFELQDDSNIKVYIQGNSSALAPVFEGNMSAGNQSISLNISNFSPSTYNVIMVVDGVSFTETLVIL